MGMVVALVILVIHSLLVGGVEVEEEPPDPYDEILDIVQKKIMYYRQAINTETDEKVKLMLITKHDALADLYLDIRLFVSVKKQKKNEK
jgi:hypothetical protein